MHGGRCHTPSQEQCRAEEAAAAPRRIPLSPGGSARLPMQCADGTPTPLSWEGAAICPRPGLSSSIRGACGALVPSPFPVRLLLTCLQGAVPHAGCLGHQGTPARSGLYLLFFHNPGTWGFRTSLLPKPWWCLDAMTGSHNQTVQWPQCQVAQEFSLAMLGAQGLDSAGGRCRGRPGSTQGPSTGDSWTVPDMSGGVQTECPEEVL